MVQGLTWLRIQLVQGIKWFKCSNGSNGLRAQIVPVLKWFIGSNTLSVNSLQGFKWAKSLSFSSVHIFKVPGFSKVQCLNG